MGTHDDLLACYFVCACIEVYVMRKCLEDIIRPFILNDQDDKYISECWRSLDQYINSQIYPQGGGINDSSFSFSKSKKMWNLPANILFDHIRKTAQRYAY